MKSLKVLAAENSSDGGRATGAREKVAEKQIRTVQWHRWGDYWASAEGSPMGATGRS